MSKSSEQLAAELRAVQFDNWRNFKAPDDEMREEIGDATPETAIGRIADAVAVRGALGAVPCTISERARSAPGGQQHAAITEEIGSPDAQPDMDGIPHIR